MRQGIIARYRIWAAAWGASALLVFLLHWSVLWKRFWADDLGFAAQSPHSVRDWLNFWNPSRGWFYRPVYLSWWGVWQNLGIANPVVMHALGLLLHATIIWLWGALVFRVSRHCGLAVVASLTFLMWPGKSEAVDWVASHSTLLAAFFALISLHAWLSWRSQRRIRWYGVALVSFWLGCCAKNEAVAALALLPCLDIWLKRGSWRSRAVALLPFVLLSGAFVALEWHAAHIYALQDHNYARNSFSLTRRLLFVLWFLDRSLFNVLPLYPLSWLSLLSLLVLPAVRRVVPGAFSQQEESIKRGLWLGTTVWLIASFPVPFASGFIAAGERFQYIPALGLSLLCAIIAAATALALAAHRNPTVETARSASALSLALLLLHAVWFVPLPRFSFEVISVLLLAGAGCCWLAFRGRWLDGRVALALWVAVVAQQAIGFFPIDVSPQVFQFVACLGLGCIWRRDWLAGTVLALAIWQNPVDAVLVFVVRAVVLRALAAHSPAPSVAASSSESISPSLQRAESG